MVKRSFVRKRCQHNPSCSSSEQCHLLSKSSRYFCNLIKRPLFRDSEQRWKSPAVARIREDLTMLSRLKPHPRWP